MNERAKAGNPSISTERSEPAGEDEARPTQAASGAHADAPVVLLVDDEPSVLSSLKRLLRPKRYRVLTAESGEAALDVLAANAVDLIVSDMRMPSMSGAEFLARARERRPDTMRILLTGYSEIDSAVRAINEAAIYRYLTKPWDDHDLLLTVEQAIEQQRLRREAARLDALLRAQNDALRAFNAGLEAQVQARTEEVRQTMLFLEDAQRDLKHDFAAMAQVCANMIELRCGALGGESRRVGEAARNLALALDMSGWQAQELFFAGLLHGIGKLSLPDELLRKPLDRMTPEENRTHFEHPLRAQMVLMPVQQLSRVAHVIHHQYERFDGRGTPDGLAGNEIPLGSRILAVAHDFEALCSGGMFKRPYTVQQATAVLVSQAGLRYDARIVGRFAALSKEPSALDRRASVSRISASQLREGMRLADDLRNGRGILLMTKGSVVSAHQAAQVRRFEAAETAPFAILVHAAGGAERSCGMFG
ncbi:HD domain-containing phosphohydrolase [Burkholderia oklahomensis]|uniref:Response regulator n=1 Tax=Burkholderia oklahomensis TaxID=342113 RepID=A0AAI8FR83_9BURK|nr:HD domain-containing phosphohydrolase [Burkholderia oklahomensis]AIO69740.1 response regulator [Burkholderia oklahomensis]AOI38869.1 two-component system response regulator [Burkholderia oklahomensis EO147]KUY65573.1 two-component system response regulator [Burkholderia oklahomensis EO147]QPS41660.1 response regulator [Burkholderia oklahomensis]